MVIGCVSSVPRRTPIRLIELSIIGVLHELPRHLRALPFLVALCHYLLFSSLDGLDCKAKLVPKRKSMVL